MGRQLAIEPDGLGVAGPVSGVVSNPGALDGSRSRIPVYELPVLPRLSRVGDRRRAWLRHRRADMDSFLGAAVTRFLRSTSHLAMQSGIAANAIVKESDNGLWMRREEVHGFRGYGGPRGRSVGDAGSVNDRREGHEREAGHGPAGSANGAQDRLTR